MSDEQMEHGHFTEPVDAMHKGERVKVLGWRRSIFDRRWYLLETTDGAGPLNKWVRVETVSLLDKPETVVT